MGSLKLAIIVFLILFSLNIVHAQEKTTLFFFYSTTCPHCRAEFEFLKSLESQCPNLEIKYFEANKNYDLFKGLADEYNTSTTGVPRTFLGDRVYVGFTKVDGTLEYNPVYKAYNGYQNVILEHINQLKNETTPVVKENESCEAEETSIDSGIFSKPKNSLAFLLILLYGLSYLFLRKKFRHNRAVKKYWVSGLLLVVIISLFVLVTSQSEVGIKNFAEKLPFPFFVTIVALADGFNPCAFMVLIILLSLLTYTKSRKDMAIVGMTFVLTSAAMYFIFIMLMVLAGSWAFQKYGSIIILLLGIVIAIAGIINIKDSFFFKKGISLTLSEKDKYKFTAKARNIVNQLRDANSKKHFFIALFGTVLLAIFVNLVELGCTAILPAVYMASLVKSFGETLTLSHIVWTLYYSAVYIIPLVGILAAFIYSFKSARISEKHGRTLKLMSGLFMLFFGLIMIAWPELLVFG